MPELLLKQPNDELILDFVISEIIFTRSPLYRWEKKRVHEITDK